jgi:hypothetical protein
LAARRIKDLGQSYGGELDAYAGVCAGCVWQRLGGGWGAYSAVCVLRAREGRAGGWVSGMALLGLADFFYRSRVF